MSETRSKLHEVSQASRAREAQALRELGSTAVSLPVAAGLVGVVLGLILTVPLLDAVGRPAIRQAWREFGGQTAVALAEARRGEWRTANEILRRAMVGIDRRLEEDSWVPAELLPPVRLAVAALGGRPSPDVVPGRHRKERWLFYRPAIDHLTGPPFLDSHWLDAQRRGIDQRPPRPQEAPDPRPATAEFAAKLEARGIELILVPVPVKAALEAERLTDLATGKPLSNPSWDELGSFVREHGMAWIDLSAEFAAAKARGVQLFLARDTHWRPEAVDIAARAVAERLAVTAATAASGREAWTEEERSVEGVGDLVAMARLPSGQTLFPRETVTVRVARAPTGEAWRRDPSSDVLVLGDSFVNVFSQAELGWGGGAGFAERLSLHLGRGVDRLAQNAGGATASREELERLAAEGDDRLAGKRVVVWVFSARELSVGDWRLSRAASALGDAQ